MPIRPHRPSVLAAVLAATIPSACSVAQSPAEILLANMSTREKAGQLFMVWSLSSAEGKARDALYRKIEAADLGGVILSLGDAPEAADLVGELQRRAPTPLLLAGDFEAGVGFRLTNTTNFGNNMLIAATGSTALAEAAGRATGVEARALGFHWCFAPVVDVNVNPANPIINVRSFGEDPARVARYAAAFTRGVEDAGVIATAKHFPGHGDVASDSHLTMPTVPGSRERLEEVELPPFRAAIEAGVSSIMSGHLAVPGLGEDPAVPATLSKRILTGLLRESWGFDGLVVTDALDMGGVREKIPPTEAAVRALRAGADVLLMPPDPAAARDAVVAAVENGQLASARLDEAVGRILRAKERLGLLDDSRTAPDPHWEAVVGQPEHRALANEIAVRGLTLVRDDAGLVPLPAEPFDAPLFVVLGDKPDDRGRSIGDALASRGFESIRLHPESDAATVGKAVESVNNADFVVAAFAIKVRSYSGSIGIPEPLRPVVDALRTRPRSVAVSLGNPYLIRDFPEVSTYLCAYAATPSTETAVADALLGRAAVGGRLPVHVPGIASLDAGLSRRVRPELGRAEPSERGLPDDLSTRIRSLLDLAIRDGAFPGASVCITRRGDIVAEVVAGRHTYDLDAPLVTPQTRFDLASLSKVCATTPTILRLVQAGAMALDTPVADLLPEFAAGEDAARRRTVTIRHLLTHSSGLPPWVKFYEQAKGRDAIVAAAAKTPLRTDPGTAYAYSDVGMILLMACAEAADEGDATFDQIARREVFEPLGMTSASYAPTDDGPLDDVPPTADEGSGLPAGRSAGLVHDENAYAMGGVSGHAGLFADARDVAVLGNAFLGGGVGWLEPGLATAARSRAGVVSDSSRGLGWDTFEPGNSGGTLLGSDAFGHTGFTGTSIWCDPSTDLCIVMLTNRVHPTRDNQRIRAVRSDLADLVAGALQR